MTATLLPNAKQAFTGPGGVPLVGGKVYTYATGTTTPLVTYADAGGTIPNANPIILDARGEAVIFWSGVYRVALYDALGNPIWTVDGIGTAGSISVGPFTGISQDTIGGNTALVDDGGIVFADQTLNDALVAQFPRTMAKSGNGRYFRRDQAHVDLAEVGVNGSGGATGDWGAMQEALTYLQRFANNFGGIYRGTPRIKLAPYQRFDLVTSLKQTVIIEGDGGGLEGGRPSIIDCSFGNSSGFIVERYDTLNSQVLTTPTTGGDNSVLRNFALLGGQLPYSQDNSTFGISLKARALLDSLYIEAFTGSGIRINAASGGTGEAHGNANVWKVRDCTVYNCFDGLYINGSDANAGYSLGCNFNGNARFGLLDNSLLGNTHMAHHTSTNGYGAHGVIGIVSYNNSYWAPAYGQDALWASTPPGTLGPQGQTVWISFQSPGPPISAAVCPLWVAGGSYLFVGAYGSTNRNCRSVFTGCYTEGTQAPPQIMWPSLAVGGFLNNKGDAPSLTGEQGVVMANAFQTGAGALEGDGLALFAQSIGRLKPNGTDLRFDWNNSDVNYPLAITGPGTPSLYGANAVYVRNRLGLPGGGAMDGFVSAAPTYTPAVPTVLFNSGAGAPNGWRNPGNSATWTTF